MKLRFIVNIYDEVREVRVREFPAQLGASRSFKCDWPGGPIYHLMQDGSVMLQSRNKPEHQFPGFGSRGQVLD